MAWPPSAGLSINKPANNYQLEASSGGTFSTPVALNVVGSPPPLPPAPRSAPHDLRRGSPRLRKLNKKLKPVGKPVLTGFELKFSTAMNPATAGNIANYLVAWTSTKKVKKKIVQVFHPVPLTVQYHTSNNSVDLLVRGKQAFATGGRIVVIAAATGGVTSTDGVSLDGNDDGTPGDNAVFTISKNARTVTGS